MINLLSSKHIKVYLSPNIKKGIISVNFYNPLVDTKTTRSLGTKVGLDLIQAKSLADEIEKTINTREYFSSYAGYLKACDEVSSEVVDLIFKDVSNYSNGAYLDTKITLLNEDENYKFNSVCLLGDPSINSELVSNLLCQNNSISNYKINNLEIVLDKSSKGFKFVSSFLSKEMIYNRVKNIVSNCLIGLITYSRLGTIDYLKFQLCSNLVAFKTDHVVKIYDRLKETSKSIVESYKRFTNNDYLSLEDYLEQSCLSYVNDCSDFIVKFLLSTINELFDSLFIEQGLLGSGVITRYEIITNKYIHSSAFDFECYEFPKNLYFEISINDNSTEPNKDMNRLFFKLLNKLFNEDCCVPTLTSILDVCRVEGDFTRPLNNSRCINNAIIFSINSANLYNSNTLKLQKSDKLLLESQPNTFLLYESVIEELVLNGRLPEVVLGSYAMNSINTLGTSYSMELLQNFNVLLSKSKVTNYINSSEFSLLDVPILYSSKLNRGAETITDCARSEKYLATLLDFERQPVRISNHNKNLKYSYSTLLRLCDKILLDCKNRLKKTIDSFSYSELLDATRNPKLYVNNYLLPTLQKAVKFIVFQFFCTPLNFNEFSSINFTIEQSQYFQRLVPTKVDIMLTTTTKTRTKCIKGCKNIDRTTITKSYLKLYLLSCVDEVFPFDITSDPNNEIYTNLVKILDNYKLEVSDLVIDL